MRSKASLSLMEQLVMVLVFALAAALCLGAFARAQTIALETENRETAAQIAQNGAELLKAGQGLEALALPEGFYVTFAPAEEAPGLSRGVVEVWQEGEKELLFSLPVAWQEELP